MSYSDLPIVFLLELGGEEFLGLRESDGGFQQVQSLSEVPKTEYHQVEMFGPSLGLLIPCTATIFDGEEPIGFVSIGIIKGRPACKSISSYKRGVTGSFLRQLPLASLVRDAAAASTVRVLRTRDGVFGARYVEGGAGFGQLHDDLRKELAEVEDKARRRVIDDGFLMHVARVYRDALLSHMPPAQHVRAMLGPTTSENARRWIAAARREGFLGPAPKRGKAGEVQEDGASE